MMMSALYWTNTLSWIFIVLALRLKDVSVQTFRTNRTHYPDSESTNLCCYSLMLCAMRSISKYSLQFDPTGTRGKYSLQFDPTGTRGKYSLQFDSTGTRGKYSLLFDPTGTRGKYSLQFDPTGTRGEQRYTLHNRCDSFINFLIIKVNGSQWYNFGPECYLLCNFVSYEITVQYHL